VSDVAERTRLQGADASANAQPKRLVGATVLPCERSLEALEVVVTDEVDAPCRGVGVELLWNAKRLVTATDRVGCARFEGLEQGEHQVGLVDLDADAWELCATEALDGARGSPRPAWEPARDAAPAAGRHTVRRGECLTSIAYAHGFALRALQEANQELIEKRQRGATLLEGDVVQLPARNVRRLAAQPGQRLRVKRRGVPETFRPRFLDFQGRPRAGLSFIAHVRTSTGDPLPDHAGTTDGGGYAVTPVPPDATSVEVTFTEELFAERHAFALGLLPPIDTVAGLMARLNALGYGCGEPESAMTDRARSALARFREGEGLSPERGFDSQAQSALARAFEP